MSASVVKLIATVPAGEMKIKPLPGNSVLYGSRSFFVEKNPRFTLSLRFMREVVDELGEDDHPHARMREVSYHDLKRRCSDGDFNPDLAFRPVTAGFVMALLLQDARDGMTKHFRGGGAYTLFPLMTGGLAYVRYSAQRSGWFINVERPGKLWDVGTRVYGY